MKPPKDYVKLQHDGNARHRDGQVEHPSDVYPILEAIEEMEERIDEPPTSVLVVGCRTGYELEELQRHFPNASVLGVDIVPEFVDAAKKRGSAILADMHNLPFARNLFDWTFCIGTLEHAYNARRCAKELLRVTRRALYVTADMEEESAKYVKQGNAVFVTSHCTFILDPDKWLAMFRNPEWTLVWKEKQEATLHMLWRRDVETKNTHVASPSLSRVELPHAAPVAAAQGDGA